MPRRHPYFAQHPDAPRRRGISRTIALRLQAAIFIRGMDDQGNPLCVWCQGVLTPYDHSIDHYNNDSSDHRPENMLPACVGCNSARGHAYPSQADANAAMDNFLRELGTTYAEAMQRVRKQLSTPIPAGPMKYSPLHQRAIVSIWRPGDPRVAEILAAFLPGQKCKGAKNAAQKGACQKGESRLDYTRRTGAERANVSRAKRREQERQDEAEPFDRF